MRDDSANVATVVTTNNAGAYVATNLDPGVYKVQAEAAGFRTAEVNDVTLEADANLKVDLALEVGAVSQAVEVTASAPAVETEQSSVARTAKKRPINELPIQGRRVRSVLPMWRVGPRGLILEAGSNGNWKKHQSGVKRDLFGVSFSSPSVGWVVGERGTILRTTDGGNNWLKMPSPTDEDLIQVSAANELRVAVTTRSGLIYTTTDGGKNWTTANQ